MTTIKKTTKEEREEHDIRVLCRALSARGSKVRRENLSRGSGFRTKSGDCVYYGLNTIFVDRRLPSTQQLAIVVEYFLSTNAKLSLVEFESLSSGTRKDLQGVLDLAEANS